MLKRISVSQVTAWLACRLKWEYRYREELAKDGEGELQSSGKAIHAAVAALLTGMSGVEGLPAVVEHSLRRSFEGREDREAKVNRYLPGALRAVGRVPSADLLGAGIWAVETPIEGSWDDGNLIIWGKPDFFIVNEDGVFITELKSTSDTDRVPLDYLLYNPQHRYYSVILRQIYPDLPVYVRYIVVYTGKTGPTMMESSWLMKTEMLDRTEREMVTAGREVGSLPILPNYGLPCNWCDYRQLCLLTITGGDTTIVKRRDFLPKSMKEE